MKSLMKRMTVTIGAAGIAEAAVAAFFSKEVSLGILIGALGAFINLLSLWYDIRRSVERGRAPRGYVGRYVFSAVLMLLGGLISVETLLGVFLGLMNLKLSAYIAGWRERG